MKRLRFRCLSNYKSCLSSPSKRFQVTAFKWAENWNLHKALSMIIIIDMLFSIAKSWMQQRCTSVGKWINHLVRLYNRILFSNKNVTKTLKIHKKLKDIVKWKNQYEKAICINLKMTFFQKQAMKTANQDKWLL